MCFVPSVVVVVVVVVIFHVRVLLCCVGFNVVLFGFGVLTAILKPIFFVFFVVFVAGPFS